MTIHPLARLHATPSPDPSNHTFVRNGKRGGIYERAQVYAGDEFATVLNELADKPSFVAAWDFPLIEAGIFRYRIFRDNPACVSCGLKGTYLALERSAAFDKASRQFRVCDEQLWHMNLYGTREDGAEVMFTQDHIIPRARGGSEDITNLQTMCSPCNNRKGHKMPEIVEETTEVVNTYDKADIVRLHGKMLAQGLKYAVYSVRPAPGDDYATERQIHMTHVPVSNYGEGRQLVSEGAATIYAMMTESQADVFCKFIDDIEAHPPGGLFPPHGTYRRSVSGLGLIAYDRATTDEKAEPGTLVREVQAWAGKQCLAVLGFEMAKLFRTLTRQFKAGVENGQPVDAG
ncbi:HNH endonuclease [Bajunvirus bajun]|uniref:HNH endonuclease n=1 Tax=Brevundimonas phage vB_BgoS-Bajun TaxID=2948594 RepID=A0A9E7SRJ0_9CAUD|nr:HNH endonuclease [Brevundimonas phage vB_BgoS-Bajun]